MKEVYSIEFQSLTMNNKFQKAFKRSEYLLKLEIFKYFINLCHI